MVKHTSNKSSDFPYFMTFLKFLDRSKIYFYIFNMDISRDMPLAITKTFNNHRKHSNAANGVSDIVFYLGKTHLKPIILAITMKILGKTYSSGADPRGGGSFWGTPKLHKEGETSQKYHILVLNSYPDNPPPPLSEILYPPLLM